MPSSVWPASSEQLVIRFSLVKNHYMHTQCFTMSFAVLYLGRNTFISCYYNCDRYYYSFCRHGKPQSLERLSKKSKTTQPVTSSAGIQAPGVLPQSRSVELVPHTKFANTARTGAMCPKGLRMRHLESPGGRSRCFGEARRSFV